MVMEREAHEALLNEILTPDLPVSRLTEIAVELRMEHDVTTEEYTGLQQNVEKLKTDNADLVQSNSKWFRMLGTPDDKPNAKEEEKSFSETVTIESLEQGG